MAPGQREGRRGRQAGAVAAAAAAAAVIVVVVAAEAVDGQQRVPELLLDAVRGALLHLDVARAVREGERGGAQLDRSRATAARVRWRSGGRRDNIAT